MKLLICGSRSIPENIAYELLEGFILKNKLEVTEVVSGGARGPDSAGELFGARHSVPIRLFKADWEVLGRRAGAIRNKQCVEYCDAVLAIYDGTSCGTDITMDMARRAGKKVWEIRYP